MHHASLTETGRMKLGVRKDRQEEPEDLEPGVDYKVKDEGGPGWVAFPDTPATQHFRHTWILVKRRRPKAPSFAGAPVPKHHAGAAERSAMLVMTYFKPWTLRQDVSDQHVIYCGRLCAEEQQWQHSLKAWLNGGIECEEAKRYVDIFYQCTE